MGLSLTDLSPITWAGDAVGDPNLLQDTLSGGAYSNAQATQAVNAQNIAFAQAQENYQTQMANTSYQRGVQDMEAAGLNPMLAYSQGGDPTPTGVSPQLQSPQPGNIGAGVAQTAQSLFSGNLQAKTQESQQNLQEAQTSLASATQDKTIANAQESYTSSALNEARRSQTFSDTQLNYSRKSQIDQQTKTEKERTRSAKADADQNEMERDISKKRFGFDKGAAVPDAVIERLKQGTGVFGNAMGAARDAAKQYTKQNVRDAWRWGKGEVQ